MAMLIVFLSLHTMFICCSATSQNHSLPREQTTLSPARKSQDHRLTQLGWIVATALSRMKAGKASSNIPGWAGYNSLLSESKPLTQVGSLPLILEVAHEWSTLLTVIMQASRLRRLAVGEDHPTIVSFDMASRYRQHQGSDTETWKPICC